MAEPSHTHDVRRNGNRNRDDAKKRRARRGRWLAMGIDPVLVEQMVENMRQRQLDRRTELRGGIDQEQERVENATYYHLCPDDSRYVPVVWVNNVGRGKRSR